MLTYEQSLKNAKLPFASWKKTESRLAPETWPVLNPKFKLENQNTIFTIGSCFARNIEQHLKRAGCKVPTLDFGVPKEEWQFRRNGILNKYTPAAIYQDVEWAGQNYKNGGFDIKYCSKLMYECKDGSVIDTNLGGFIPVSKERFTERRKEIYTVYEKLFTAECIVITLGLVETWYDEEQKYFIQTAPIQRSIENKDRFTFKILSFNDCKRFIEDAISIIKEINPQAKFLISTSPVPLERTFSGQDIITANLYSKSTLRSVCGDVILNNDYIDYFPSFESVMLTKSWDVWMEDRRHVTDDFVNKIVKRLINDYFNQNKVNE